MDTYARAQSYSGATLTSTPTDSSLWETLAQLQLNIAQTAALCGISVRQLGYWTKQGYVTATGHGERRMYGLEAVRRILAIRRAMGEGASLRQALRLVSEGRTSAMNPFLHQADAPSGDGAFLSYDDVGHETAVLPPADADVLARQIIALFDGNRGIRDDSEGLAVKVGRPVADVRRAAEALCAQGLLSMTPAGSQAVFQRVGEGT